MRRSAFFLLLLLFPALPGRAQQDTSWQIYLDRPAAVGDRFALASSGNQVRHSRSSLPGQAPEDTEDTLEITYAGTHEVLDIGKNGMPVHMRLTVERLETNDGSGPQSQFAPGTVLEARAEGDETRFFQGREPLEGTLHDALNLAGANLGSVNEPSEDEVFKNYNPVRSGTRLPADSRLLARAISLTTPFLVDSAGTSAEVLFDKAVSRNDIPALATESKFHIAIKGFKTSPGQPLKDSFIRSITTRVLPIDPSLPLIHEALETDMRISSRTKEEEPAKDDDDGESPGFTTTFHRKAARDVKPLPPAAPAGRQAAVSKS
ncbi:MAG: hypothetical protein V4726_14250 [Verrucomicrobiota bacterium]